MSFSPIQRLVAQITLDAISPFGFALGGGQALHAHGYGNRASLDMDFYIPQFEQDIFDQAETATVAALRARGFVVVVGHSDSWLRQIIVTDPGSGEQTVVDLGQDYREHPVASVAGLGPVIALSDLAAAKARALNDRRAARDYLDIHVLLTRGPWSPMTLFVALRDQLRPTITTDQFADDLLAAGEQDPEDYVAYGLTPDEVRRLSQDFAAWARQLREAQP